MLRERSELLYEGFTTDDEICLLENILEGLDSEKIKKKTNNQNSFKKLWLKVQIL